MSNNMPLSPNYTKNKYNESCFHLKRASGPENYVDACCVRWTCACTCRPPFMDKCDNKNDNTHYSSNGVVVVFKHVEIGTQDDRLPLLH
jgi:hypothetical protein